MGGDPSGLVDFLRGVSDPTKISIPVRDLRTARLSESEFNELLDRFRVARGDDFIRPCSLIQHQREYGTCDKPFWMTRRGREIMNASEVAPKAVAASQVLLATPGGPLEPKILSISPRVVASPPRGGRVIRRPVFAIQFSSSSSMRTPAKRQLRDRRWVTSTRRREVPNRIPRT
jgi:hypothetical protein